MLVKSLFSTLAIIHLACSQLMGGAGCPDSYTECAPDGANPREVPALGNDWAFFFLSLVSVVPSSPDTNASTTSTGDADLGGPVRRAADDLFCCASSSMCLLIPSYKLPACYDKFTTDYFLNDGSHGTMSNGSYDTADGGTADLFTGNFSLADGTKGNIYDSDPADRPDTATLSMPTPFTSSGVGSAIPGSELGATVSATATATSLGPGIVAPSTTSVPNNTTPAVSSTDTVFNSGIVPPFVTDTLTGTPSLVSGTVGSNNTSMAPSGTASRGSAAFSFPGYATSPILPQITNIAAVSMFRCLAPTILLSVLVAVLVG